MIRRGRAGTCSARGPSLIALDDAKHARLLRCFCREARPRSLQWPRWLQVQPWPRKDGQLSARSETGQKGDTPSTQAVTWPESVSSALRGSARAQLLGFGMSSAKGCHVLMLLICCICRTTSGVRAPGCLYGSAADSARKCRESADVMCEKLRSLRQRRDSGAARGGGRLAWGSDGHGAIRCGARRNAWLRPLWDPLKSRTFVF